MALAPQRCEGIRTCGRGVQSWASQRLPRPVSTPRTQAVIDGLRPLYGRPLPRRWQAARRLWIRGVVRGVVAKPLRVLVAECKLEPEHRLSHLRRLAAGYLFHGRGGMLGRHAWEQLSSPTPGRHDA